MDTINKGVGISESADNIAQLLTRMCLKSTVVEEGRAVEVEVPPSRAGKWAEPGVGGKDEEILYRGSRFRVG